MILKAGSPTVYGFTLILVWTMASTDTGSCVSVLQSCYGGNGGCESQVWCWEKAENGLRRTTGMPCDWTAQCVAWLVGMNCSCSTLLLQISVGVEVMVSGIPMCCYLTVIPKKSIFNFPTRRYSQRKQLIAFRNALALWGHWCYISSWTVCACVCAGKSTSLKQAGCSPEVLFFSCSWNEVSFWSSGERELRSLQVSLAADPASLLVSFYTRNPTCVYT